MTHMTKFSIFKCIFLKKFTKNFKFNRNYSFFSPKKLFFPPKNCNNNWFLKQFLMTQRNLTKILNKIYNNWFLKQFLMCKIYCAMFLKNLLKIFQSQKKLQFFFLKKLQKKNTTITVWPVKLVTVTIFDNSKTIRW